MYSARPATREKWLRIIEAQRASGQTVTAYCRQRAIAQASFYLWKHRLQSAAGQAGFVQVHAIDSSRPAHARGERACPEPVEGVEPDGIDVCLPHGRRVRVRRGFDHYLFAELMGVLEGLP